MSALPIVHFLLLLYCTAVSADGRIRDQDLDAINFAKAINGKMLNGSVFQNISVDSEMFCQLTCVKDIRCLSYNYGTMNRTGGKEDNSFNCQLSDSDRFTSHENFTDDIQSLYRGIQSICESDNTPCGDKEICIPDYHGNTFKCKCATGDNPTSCGCPNGWVKNESSCYHIEKTRFLKWSDARSTSQDMGGDLAIIKSAEENNFLFSLVKKAYLKNWGAWIGLYKKPADPTFYWIDDAPAGYTAWGSGEPNNNVSKAACGVMKSLDNGMWYDEYCEMESRHQNNAPVPLCQKAAAI